MNRPSKLLYPVLVLSVGALGIQGAGTLPVSAAPMPSRALPQDVTDYEAPVLVSSTVTPSQGDVTAADLDVTVRATITDPTGVEAPVVSLNRPDGNSYSRATMHLVSGTVASGVWEGSLKIPRGSLKGTWTVSAAQLTDTNGNQGQYQQLGVVRVANTFTPDTQFPAVGKITFSPDSVDVTKAPATITVTIDLADATGATAPTAFLRDEYYHQLDTSEMTLISGTEKSGTWSATLTVEQGFSYGTVYAEVEDVADFLGNKMGPTVKVGTIAVTNTPDDEPPLLESSDVAPRSVDTGTTSATVTATASITDFTGTNPPIAVLSRPDGATYSRVTMKLISGDSTDGVWQAKYTVPKTSMAGTWVVGIDSLSDAKGNTDAKNSQIGQFSVRNTSAQTYPATGRFGEHTGDAFADIYGIASNGDLDLIKGGPTTASRISTFSSTMTGVTYLAQIGDWTGDNRSDALARTQDNALWIYSSSASGGLTPWRQIGSNWGSMDQIVYAGLLDGRSRYVVARQASTGDLYRYTMTTGGLTNTTKIGSGWGGMRSFLSVGDFNGDGLADVIGIRRSDGTMWSYAGSPQGTLGAGRQIGNGWSSFTQAFTAGDLTGDGRFDLLGVNATGTLYEYANTGHGGWGDAKRLASGFDAYKLLA